MDLKSQQELMLRYLFEEGTDSDDTQSELASLGLLKGDHEQSISSKLLEVYPVLARTVGLEDFSVLNIQFMKQYRPTSSDLADCSLSFYEFFKTHEIINEIPMLLDLARLELRRIQSAQAPSLAALSLDVLLQQGDGLDSITLSLQPHVFVSQFHHPVYTIWLWALACDGQDDEACSRLPIQEYAESVLTFRSGSHIVTRKISREASVFLKEFKAGKTLAAVEASHDYKEGRELLEYMIRQRLLVADV
jgi:hypothetical protein